MLLLYFARFSGLTNQSIVRLSPSRRETCGCHPVSSVISVLSPQRRNTSLFPGRNLDRVHFISDIGIHKFGNKGQGIGHGYFRAGGYVDVASCNPVDIGESNEASACIRDEIEIAGRREVAHLYAPRSVGNLGNDCGYYGTGALPRAIGVERTRYHHFEFERIVETFGYRVGSYLCG